MNGDTIGQLIYLVLLLLFVGGWFFARNRNRLNRTLQQAVLWVFLFAGMIVIYGMRDQLRQQLLPRSSVSVQGDNIILTRAADRHFYVTMKLNGVPVRFVVDTGATNMVLSRQDARRIGIDPDGLIYYSTAQTANGTVRTARVRIKTVELAGKTDRNVTAWVNDGQMDGSLLGMSYLSRFSTIEISGDRMILRR